MKQYMITFWLSAFACLGGVVLLVAAPEEQSELPALSQLDRRNVIKMGAATEKEIELPASSEVIKILDRVGIPADSATLVHRKQIGHSPQVVQDVCFYSVKWKDAVWKVGIDAITRHVVDLWGEVAFLPANKSERIRRHEDAVRLADGWFRRFGVEIEKTLVSEVTRHERSKGIWRVSRFRLVAPKVMVRVGADIELDEVTGGLVKFNLDPEFSVPMPLPAPTIASERATTLALDQIAKRRTEHYEPSTDAHLLDCFQFITWKRQPGGELRARLCWWIRFYGRAKQISHLPLEFQERKPPQVVPVLWGTLVDAETGDVDIHWVSRRNELFTDGKLYRW